MLGDSRESLLHVQRALRRLRWIGRISRVSGVQATVRKLRFGRLPDALVADADIIAPYRLSALPPSTRASIILLGTRERQAARAFDLGIGDFLRRPITTTRVVAALRRIAGESSEGPPDRVAVR